MSQTPAHISAARRTPGGGAPSRHLLVAVAVNRPGVLNRVTSLFRARDFNIESLTANHTDRPGLSRMAIVISGDDDAVEQASKQLYRLIDVVKVADVTNEQVIDHELSLIKIRAGEGQRAQVLSIIRAYAARVVDLSRTSLIVEASGTSTQVDDLVSALRGFGIAELVRSGPVVMSCGSGSVEDEAGRAH